MIQEADVKDYMFLYSMIEEADIFYVIIQIDLWINIIFFLKSIIGLGFIGYLYFYYNMYVYFL